MSLPSFSSDYLRFSSSTSVDAWAALKSSEETSGSGHTGIVFRGSLSWVNLSVAERADIIREEKIIRIGIKPYYFSLLTRPDRQCERVIAIDF